MRPNRFSVISREQDVQKAPSSENGVKLVISGQRDYNVWTELMGMNEGIYCMM